jgi:putative FmdB family regulatory protein
MPIYEFQCLDCGHEFEELVRSADRTDGLTCPVCERSDVRKKISTFAAPVISGGKVSSWSSPSNSCRTGST